MKVVPDGSGAACREHSPRALGASCQCGSLHLGRRLTADPYSSNRCRNERAIGERHSLPETSALKATSRDPSLGTILSLQLLPVHGHCTEIGTEAIRQRVILSGRPVFLGDLESLNDCDLCRPGAERTNRGCRFKPAPVEQGHSLGLGLWSAGDEQPTTRLRIA
jgi:hypothetical protein